MINIELLSKLCEAPGAPGFENPIRHLIQREVNGLVDEMVVDNLGNLIVTKKGREDKQVLVAAHMDEISFIVSFIDDDGFVRIQPLGGFDPKTLTAQRVIIHGKEDIMGVMGSKPIHLMTKEEKNRSMQIKDYFVDTGRSKEDLEKLIAVGSPITRERGLIQMGDCVNSKSLDNRVSVFILIEMLKSIQNVDLPYDLVGVFTVQEEVGLRGAQTAANAYNPYFTINLDVTVAFDVPGAQPQEQVSKLGKGVAIKILDGSTICDQRMVRFMKQQAESNNIPWQAELLPAGGTDTAAFQRNTKGGSIVGGISIPCRNLHQVIEMCHTGDIQNSIDLLRSCICEMDKIDLNF